MTYAASRKSASRSAQGDQAIVPPSRGTPDISNLQRRDSTAAQRKRSKFTEKDTMALKLKIDAGRDEQ